MPARGGSATWPGVPSLLPLRAGAGGLLRVGSYDRLLASERFTAVERFSDAFLEAHRIVLEPYAQKWVEDPLHQWSRQWEYPWVLAAIEATCPAAGARWLDAGSGATFFPFLIAERWPGIRVACCDQDATLEPIVASIAASRRAPVAFRAEPLGSVSTPPASFDGIYCISVLEHTHDHEAILDHFRTMLRPGGTLLLTFDVSLDGRSEIAPDGAARLLDAVHARFEPVAAPTSQSFSTALTAPDVLTTAHFLGRRARLLPWRLSRRFRLWSVLTGTLTGPPFCLYAVVCGAWRRPVDDEAPVRTSTAPATRT